ncbi:MAG TPA: D-alanine--D-alanine ligase [Tissierellaceae bacterium]|nr:D-alanine--D-alanine ligase [Tissierellaceae bacterium]
MKIFLIFGGKSAEHDVSVISAYHILQEIYYKHYQVVPVFISKEGKWLKGDLITKKEEVPSLSELQELRGEDFHFEELTSDSIAFPVLHGPNGEDGTIQGLFEMLDIPYVGCGVLASSAGMDKIVSKVLFEDVGIPIVPYEVVTQKKWKENAREIIERVEEGLPYPLYIKPANLGSSVGITEVHDREELKAGIDLALEYDHRVLVEEGITATEVEVAVLGNEDIASSVVGALIKDTHFYDYDSKYIDGEVSLQIPAELTEELSKQIRDYAMRAFQAIDGSGLARVDFFVTEDDNIYINEINTFPGFTPISMYPKLWEKTGLTYGDLIEKLIQLAIHRHSTRTEKYGKDRK